MKSLNRVEMIVTVLDEPQIYVMDRYIQCAIFRVFESVEIQSNKGNDLHVNTFNIVAWNELSNIAYQFLDVGHTIFLEGYLCTRLVRKDTVVFLIAEVVMTDVIILHHKDDNRYCPYIPDKDEYQAYFYEPPLYPDVRMLDRLGITKK